MIRVIVCGGRDYHAKVELFNALDAFHTKNHIIEVIHGAARGADTLAGEWAASRMVPCTPVPADWEKYKKAAGFRRNEEMLKRSPGYVIAFPGGNGTAHMVEIATKAGVPVWAPRG